MKRIDLLFLKIFVYGLPIVFCYAVFVCSYNWETSVQAGGFVRAVYDFGGFVFGSWMVLSIYLSIRLMVSGPFREKVLARLVFIKERDEREIMLTGKATKITMLTTLAILIFFFSLSCFRVSVYSIPPEKVIDGKTKVVSLELKFELLESLPKEVSQDVIQKQNIFAYTGLPVSCSAVIFGLIIWQIIAYNYWMRRLMK